MAAGWPPGPPGLTPPMPNGWEGGGGRGKGPVVLLVRMGGVAVFEFVFVTFGMLTAGIEDAAEKGMRLCMCDKGGVEGTELAAEEWDSTPLGYIIRLPP